MRSSRLAALLVALFIISPAVHAAPPAPGVFGPQPQPEARLFVDLTIRSGAEAETLAGLLPEWDEALEAGATQVILTQPEIDKLRSLGYEVTIAGRAPAAPDAWPACYSRLDTLYSWLDSYAAAHPNLVEVIDYGDSWCKQQGGCFTSGGQYLGGHDLLVARITNELAAGPNKYAATISDRPYMRVYGPDARIVAASPSSIPSGDALTVTAQINDTQNGCQAISAAEAYLVRQGGPAPGDPGTGTALAAADGSFNSTVENVTATVSTAGRGPGRYVARARGKDAGDNWGPFSAAPFEVTCFFADLDCSGEVDVLDVTLAAGGLLAAWQFGAYDTVYDVNDDGAGNGVIDIADVQIVASYFGQTAP